MLSIDVAQTLDYNLTLLAQHRLLERGAHSKACWVLFEVFASFQVRQNEPPAEVGGVRSARVTDHRSAVVTFQGMANHFRISPI